MTLTSHLIQTTYRQYVETVTIDYTSEVSTQEEILHKRA